LTTSEPYNGNDNLHVGDGKGLPISHVGHTKLYTPHRSFTLSNVLHVPAITKPLLSVQKFCLDNNVYFEFHPFLFYVKDLNTNEVLLSGHSKDGLYTLSRFRSSIMSVPQAYWSPCISTSADLWHRRLGHPTSHIFQFLVLKNKIICNNKRLNCQCQSCPLEKSSRLSLRPTSHKTSAPLELIFSDVWGPAPLFSMDSYRYFVIFVDAHTKYIWYYPLVAKSDVYSVFHQFQTLVERQFSLKIKSVQTDWAGEYRKLSTFFQIIGIHHRLICPHTHEQNGTIERCHRHIVETGLTLLGQCKALFRFWNYAFDTSVYLINRMPLLFLIIDLHLIVCFNGLLIIIFCVLLDVSVFLFCAPIIIINWIFGLLHVCFLAAVPLTLVIDVLTLTLIACISLVMSVFMNMFFHLINLNILHRFQLKPTHHLMLPSSQI